MGRKQRVIVFGLLALCFLTAAGYVVYSRTVKDYVSCARMLSKTYNADSSDLTFYVTIDTAGQAIDAQFRAVRFPYQKSTATQVTIVGKNGDYTFYKVNGRNLSSVENADVQDGIPRRNGGPKKKGGPRACRIPSRTASQEPAAHQTPS